MLIDTHCHLDFPEFEPDRDEVIRLSQEKGITRIINIGSSLEGSIASVALAQKYESVYASVGLHPHEADRYNSDMLVQLRKLAGQNKVVAIGEVGLDYFKHYSGQENQKKLFPAMIDLAKDLQLPLVIHSREAEDDTLAMLKDKMPLRAVVHCFSGDRDFLNSCLKLGFFISFTCNITYKKAGPLRELAALVPLERLMLETDAPFLSPEGFRGKRNAPWQVALLAEEFAKLRNKEVAEIAEITTQNAKAFFKLG